MRKVETSMLIDEIPEKVLEAFVKPELLHKWWEVERSIVDLRKGGIYALTWNITEKGFGFIETGVIKSYRPSKQLWIENLLYFNVERSILGPMTLKVKTSPYRGKTKLVLIQDGLQDGPDWDWYYEALRFAWPATLSQLKVFLERSKDQ